MTFLTAHIAFRDSLSLNILRVDGSPEALVALNNRTQIPMFYGSDWMIYGVEE
jgi:hypothetical protein